MTTSMDQDFLALLRCPQSGKMLRHAVPRGDIAGSEGYLASADGRYRYPIRNGIPRFVPQSNYADNFGMQWNHFAKTQLDSHSGHPISSERFWKATGWNPSDLTDKWVLDVGCGSGRFAEIVLRTGAHVVALDYSSAVDACWENLKHHPRLNVVQADIYSLPFEHESFDYVYSLGVLQHTPDVEKAFMSLPPMVVGGGRLCVDYYEKSLKSRLLPKYWLRPITKRMEKKRLFSILKASLPILLPVSQWLGRLPVFGRLLKRLVPVANYEGILPLTKTQLREWALLDTFDWLSPANDNPQTRDIARLWFEKASFSNIAVLKAGHLVARGVKPLA